MFRKVLIANRGEIAVRITRTLQQMGITAAAVYSEPDRSSLHARLADEAYALGGATSGETYLSIEKMLAAVRESGAEAVHPGYGFLSENPAFAAALEAAGVKLIGPAAAAMRAMGDKIEARRIAEAAGVPVIPGWSGEACVKELKRVAGDIGYPVLVKAAAGGGGRGMRRVNESSGLGAAVSAAQAEAEAAFGDGRIYLERYVRRPRHVEFQVLADSYGNTVHLFERECSVQRRHQKIAEEAPSPALDGELRERMGEAAVRLARAAGYENAGTVEFILDQDGRFYFLEMNTRLQVEHPVTELATGRDLVRLQVQIAAGEPLPFRQEDLRQSGHSLECRIYAEDPERGFVPSTGTIRVYREPAGPGIRVDSGVEQGSEVSVHYDPLLAKLVVWAEDREQALDRTDWALSEFVVLGVRTNIGFLRALVRHPEFRAGRLHTHFLEEHAVAAPAAPPPVHAFAAAALALGSCEPKGRRSHAAGAPAASPWTEAGPWRLA